jgi:hypothetical protein
MPFTKPHPLSYVRLRCENPACDLFYLAHPDEPVFVCFSCEEKARNRLLRQAVKRFVYNPVRVYNRYDKVFSIHLNNVLQQF